MGVRGGGADPEPLHGERAAPRGPARLGPKAPRGAAGPQHPFERLERDRACRPPDQAGLGGSPLPRAGRGQPEGALRQPGDVLGPLRRGLAGDPDRGPAAVQDADIQHGGEADAPDGEERLRRREGSLRVRRERGLGRRLRRRGPVSREGCGPVDRAASRVHQPAVCRNSFEHHLDRNRDRRQRQGHTLRGRYGRRAGGEPVLLLLPLGVGCPALRVQGQAICVQGLLVRVRYAAPCRDDLRGVGPVHRGLRDEQRHRRVAHEPAAAVQIRAVLALVPRRAAPSQHPRADRDHQGTSGRHADRVLYLRLVDRVGVRLRDTLCAANKRYRSERRWELR
mmetsp:Transcript_40575/g.116156  ORF Transcript_40575/g.116156 Transcript_40575/m.116156 type:complete len:337 (-) Transcript_40575:614-1624(-)